jgi:hypothetical protein
MKDGSIDDADEPYRAAYLRGSVEVRGDPDATERMHQLALKYEGTRYPEPVPSSVCMVIVRVERSGADDYSALHREARAAS